MNARTGQTQSPTPQLVKLFSSWEERADVHVSPNDGKKSGYVING